MEVLADRMEVLEESYRLCRQIARSSGSSFYRSFSLLSKPRRQAMEALYAFARILDDQADEDSAAAWDPNQWHHWIDNLAHPNSLREIGCLSGIRTALSDSIPRYAIPLSVLHELIDGVASDLRENGRLKDWPELRRYCYCVASTIGVGCLHIWGNSEEAQYSPASLQAAENCGIAFQLTNILRDLVEDAKRNRSYIPDEDLLRFGIDPSVWLASLKSQSSIDTVRMTRVIQLYSERAAGHFDSGWKTIDSLCLEGQRMFSLMWSTYRCILEAIERDPLAVLQRRVSPTRLSKLNLAASHFFTPLYERRRRRQSGALRPAIGGDFSTDCIRRVAVIGGGLAGCNAAIHLRRHGLQVDLYEAKNRLGGRVGSFWDDQAKEYYDYCQHVGMKCCHELQRWIRETNQQEDWKEQRELHFLADAGKQITVRALPLPAPFHLGSLLWNWPNLRWFDRIGIARALLELIRMKPTADLDRQLAIEWLKTKSQSAQSLRNFWETILISALGEQLDRVTLGATRKVLVDGFAATRDAFHLLVPKKPLSELVDEKMRSRLVELGVQVRDGTSIHDVESRRLSQVDVSTRDGSCASYDAVLVAIPWYQASKWIEGFAPGQIVPLESSPITGVHTWWDRPWLTSPHAILVNRFCQWVFPAPGSAEAACTRASVSPGGETYYQIVISGSRELPRGDPNGIIDAVKQDLSDVFPAAAVATLLRGRVVTDPNAVFSVSPTSPEGRLSGERFADQGIYLAGDWTDTGWPATMEGALRSGVLAAESILRACGVPARIRSSD